MPNSVIIADRDPFQRAYLRDLLVKRGYLVIGEAGDGKGTLALTRELHPDLVLLDVHIPDQDGFLMTEQLAQENVASMLLLSSIEDLPHGEYVRKSRIINYIIKPVRESTVVPAIEVALARYRESCQVEEKIRVLTAQLENWPMVERLRGMALEHQMMREN